MAGLVSICPGSICLVPALVFPFFADLATSLLVDRFSADLGSCPVSVPLRAFFLVQVSCLGFLAAWELLRLFP